MADALYDWQRNLLREFSLERTCQMADVEALIEETMERVSEVGDDTVRLTQEDSAEFFEGVAQECRTRARTIREEIEAAENDER